MRTLALLLLFIAFPLAGGTLKPELEVELWKHAGGGAKLARAVINQADCTLDQQHFQSCRQALLTGAELKKMSGDPVIRNLRKQEFDKDYPFADTLELILADPHGHPIEWVVGHMVNAQLKVFDPFARLVPKANIAYLTTGQSQTAYGTGLDGEASAKGLYVVRVVPMSAAAKAHIQVHDRVTEVDGRKITNLSQANAAIRRLNADPGAPVEVKIERRGKALGTFSLQAAAILPPGNAAEIFSVGESHFLNVRLVNFSDDTCEFVRSRVAYAQRALDLAGVTLDLRRNPGGLVEAAECIVRLFTAAEVVVGRAPLRFGFPRALDFKIPVLPDARRGRDTKPLFADLPLTVVIDATSKSASEITAAALQDLKRAWVIGERSYGKGTTQVLQKLKDFPGLLVTKTISRYLRPSGLSVHELGVTPNFEMPFRPGMTASERRFARQEDSAMTFKFELGDRWKEDRVARHDEVIRCLGRDQLARQTYLAVTEHLGYPDQQLSAALAVMKCDRRGND